MVLQKENLRRDISFGSQSSHLLKLILYFHAKQTLNLTNSPQQWQDKWDFSVFALEALQCWQFFHCWSLQILGGAVVCCSQASFWFTLYALIGFKVEVEVWIDFSSNHTSFRIVHYFILDVGLGITTTCEVWRGKIIAFVMVHTWKDAPGMESIWVDTFPWVFTAASEANSYSNHSLLQYPHDRTQTEKN